MPCGVLYYNWQLVVKVVKIMQPRPNIKGANVLTLANRGTSINCDDQYGKRSISTINTHE